MSAKEVNVNAKDQTTTIRGGTGNGGNNSGVGDSASGGNGSGKSESIKSTNVNGSNNVDQRSAVKTGSANIQSGVPSGSDGKSSRGNSGNDRGSDGGSAGGSNGGYNGSDIGSAANQEKKIVADIKSKAAPKKIKPSAAKQPDKKKAASVLDPDTIASLIVSVSNTYAQATKKAFWEIAEDEAKTIAEPAAVVLSSIPKNQIDRVNKFMAPLSLIIAAATVIGPRMAIDMQMSKRRSASNANNQQPPKPTDPSYISKVNNQSEPIRSQVDPGDRPSGDVYVDPKITGLINGMDQFVPSGSIGK